MDVAAREAPTTPGQSGWSAWRGMPNEWSSWPQAFSGLLLVQHLFECSASFLTCLSCFAVSMLSLRACPGNIPPVQFSLVPWTRPWRCEWAASRTCSFSSTCQAGMVCKKKFLHIHVCHKDLVRKDKSAHPILVFELNNTSSNTEWSRI